MKSIFIYGTGLIAKHLVYHIRDEINIKGFIETNPSCELFMNKKVFSSDILLQEKYDKVFIASSYQEDIVRLLLSKGIPSDKIEELYNAKESDVYYDLRLAMMRGVAERLKEDNINGAVAELGVYKGGFSKYINRSFPDSTFYLFDTFEGFSEKDIEIERKMNLCDGSEKNVSTGELCFSNVDYVINRLEFKEKAIVKKGYFPETAYDVNDEFIFVLIDVDLFNPIYEGLIFFWPKMKKGGCIFVHDYGSVKWKGAKEAIKKFSKEADVSYIPLVDMGGSVIFVK